MKISNICLKYLLPKKKSSPKMFQSCDKFVSIF